MGTAGAHRYRRINTAGLNAAGLSAAEAPCHMHVGDTGMGAADARHRTWFAFPSVLLPTTCLLSPLHIFPSKLI